MNAAARLISSTEKFDHGLTHRRHDVLHWVDISERIKFRLCHCLQVRYVYTEWHLVIPQSYADKFLQFTNDGTYVLLVAAS